MIALASVQVEVLAPLGVDLLYQLQYSSVGNPLAGEARDGWVSLGSPYLSLSYANKQMEGIVSDGIGCDVRVMEVIGFRKSAST